MKLTVGKWAKQSGFALPTILLVSTVMLTILTASIAAAAASRVSLDSQYFNQLAKQAAQSGIARASECLAGSGYKPQWTTTAESRNLRPNSDCTGATMVGPTVSAYVVGASGTGNVRTRYSIEAPNGTNVGSILQVIGTTELVRTSSPSTVWRTYEQSLYHRIEAPQAVACPEGFASVPGDSRFGTNDFCIGKYEAKNVGGTAASVPDGAPFTNITQTAARDAAQNACAGCRLISEAQWLTVAHNVVNVSSNWSNGSVGSGEVYIGHTDNSPSGGQAASGNDSDGYFNTGSSTGNARRTLTLSNGEVVWDLSGNVSEWTTGTVTGAGNQPGAAGGAFREWNAIGGTGTLSPNPFPVFGTPAASAWTGSTGIGRVNSNSSEAGQRGFIRGGNSGDGNNAGIFGLGLDNAPGGSAGYIGFRIVFVPLSETQCAAGYVPVPGNSLFDTNDFCVAKYESKNVSGYPESQPSGLPWVNVSQFIATLSAILSGTCSNCSVISEAQWLTIAHNIATVPSNWTGGSVGNGTIYRGHTDNNPSAPIAASSNDADGYFGTNNASGNQRRTLTLSNGSVIWDFSGNVWEWTTGQISSGQPGGSGWGWRQWNTINNSMLSPDPVPAFGNSSATAWNFTNGIGQIYSNSSDTTTRAFLRSGNWNDGSGYGIFSLALNRETNTSHADAGFRMTATAN